MYRRIPLGRMLNLRDLGGYPAEGGKMTRWGRLLRGDTPVGLSRSEVDGLRERGITTVVDLRSREELERAPDQLQGEPGFHYFHIPLTEGAKLPNQEELVGWGYFRMLERKEEVKAVLEAIADAPAGVLFHCTAGKDRTGCIAALLLTVAGVDRLDILADYQVSETYIRPVIQWMRKSQMDLPAYVGASRPEYLEDCLNRLEEAYGSIPDYIRAAGLSEQHLDRLRRKLLEE